jgi:hypothetical protein
VPVRSISAPLASALARHGWLIAIIAAYLYVFPYFPRIHSANELPRVYLVRAIVDDHTFAIDRGVATWGATADVSPYNGHQYSNKAPGSSLLVAPVYAAVRMFGDPGLAGTMWLCRIVAGVIPMALFLWQLSGFLARFAEPPEVRRLVLVAYALGSMAMTYSLLYYSHQLAAICIASAWILAEGVLEGCRGSWAVLGVGLLAGAAPLVDYQAAFAGVPLAIYVATGMRAWPRDRITRALGLATAAAAVPILLLLWYHAACFGSPWRTGYDASETFAHFHRQGFLGITSLRANAFWGSLFAADNGLLALSPWWLLAVPGGIVAWRRGHRALVATSAAIAVMFVLFVSSINFWRGGWGVGPRYITAMLPFLLPLVAVALDAWRARPLVIGAAAGLIVAAVAIYALSAATLPYWPDMLPDPLYEVTFRLLRDGAVAPNLATACGISGLAGIVPFLALVAGVTGFAIARVATWRGLVVAVVVAVAIIAAFALVPHGGPAAERAYVQTLYPAVAR